jgi:hypothetical protein
MLAATMMPEMMKQLWPRPKPRRVEVEREKTDDVPAKARWSVGSMPLPLRQGGRRLGARLQDETEGMKQTRDGEGAGGAAERVSGRSKVWVQDEEDLEGGRVVGGAG